MSIKNNNFNLKISIIIPCFNEVKTIEKIINKIIELQDLNKEIIVVDDFSIDGTRELLSNTLAARIDKLILNNKNYGKGYSINQAKKKISGDIIIIQDADLEYEPKDYYKLLEPIIKKETNVVYGSRVLGKKRYSGQSFISLSRIFFNHILTILSNLINSQNLTDAHTCYKVFTRNIFEKIDLKENSFSFCPEVTTKISNLNEKIIEVPINYNGREYKDGKKIKIYDGFDAIKALFLYKFFKKK